ncbi:hypothetical protein ACB094_07G026100 [Castanea mollissima]
MSTLSLLDRATIMSPGATMGFFPVDHITLEHLKLIGQFSINGHVLFFGGSTAALILWYQDSFRFSCLSWLGLHIVSRLIIYFGHRFLDKLKL